MQQSPKIIVNIMLSKGKGGIENSFWNYTQMLQHYGHKVYNIVHKDSDFAKNAKDNPFICPVSVYSQYDVMAYWCIARLIKKISPDAVLCHGNRATLLSYFTSVPRIVIAHNEKAKYLKSVSHVICVSGYLAEKYHKRDKVPCTILHNFMPFNADMAGYHKPSVAFDTPIIGAMARFDPRKGMDLYLQALKLLKDRGVKFHACLAGGGDVAQEKHIYDLIKNLELNHNITVMGWVKNPKDFFEKIQICCLPSRQESCPMIVLESVLYKTPLIYANLAGVNELLETQDFACSFAVGDIQAMADALEKACGNYPLLQNAVDNKGYDWLWKHHSYEAAHKIICDVLERVNK